MLASPRRSPALAAALILAACNGVEGGSQDAASASCALLCQAQAAGAGCDDGMAACSAQCGADAKGFTEACLVKAKAYYDCAARIAWACPTAPDRPETQDDACDAEEHAWAVCKVTGE